MVVTLDFLQHNRYFEELKTEYWKPGVFTRHVESPFCLENYTRMADVLKFEASVTQTRTNTSWDWPLLANFRTLCSGDSLMVVIYWCILIVKENLICTWKLLWKLFVKEPEYKKPRLACMLETFQKLYWILGPLQVEILNDNPRIIQVYNFIGDVTMEKMKNATFGKLRRSKVELNWRVFYVKWVKRWNTDFIL